MSWPTSLLIPLQSAGGGGFPVSVQDSNLELTEGLDNTNAELVLEEEEATYP